MLEVTDILHFWEKAEKLVKIEAKEAIFYLTGLGTETLSKTRTVVK
jgi:hypothetical protein